MHASDDFHDDASAFRWLLRRSVCRYSVNCVGSGPRVVVVVRGGVCLLSTVFTVFQWLHRWR